MYHISDIISYEIIVLYGTILYCTLLYSTMYTVYST